MAIAQLPGEPQPPDSGWRFCGIWAEADQALITQTLSERVPNKTQALADPWLFLATEEGYYAHCPTIHQSGYGYCEDTAADLADTLWGHYFTLRLGPLVLAASPPDSPPANDGKPGTQAPVLPNIRERLAREHQSLEHFQNALEHIRQGAYAAAKQEMQISLALYPASNYYSFKRVETLGDIESYLGDDQIAERHYMWSLALVTQYRESWVNTELRLKLAWCALRQGRLTQAHAHIDAGISACERGRVEDGGSRSLNTLHGLALATLADLYLHQRDSDAALAATRDAAAIVSRLGQSYGEKARVYVYLAWQLYLHGETGEARSLAKRAWTALDRWVPVASAQTQAMRLTLTTVLGGHLQRPQQATGAALPSPQAMVATALAAVRQMQSWPEQTCALHALAPYLEPGQLQGPFDDIIAWSDEDQRYFAPYRTLLAADLALAIGEKPTISTATLQALVATDWSRLSHLLHEYLYAETLVRLRDQVESHQQEMIMQRIEACAAKWRDRLSRHSDDATGLIGGLTVCLPHLQVQAQHSAITQIEAHLALQLRGTRYTPAVFLAALPALSRLNAGEAIFESIVRGEFGSATLWIACLPHAVALNLDELRAWIVETVLNNLKRRAPFSSTTEIAELIGHLAPYLRGDEVHQALTLATPVRAIVPRVRALAALAAVLPAEERQPVLMSAWQAASRSKNADSSGAALAAIAVGVALNEGYFRRDGL